jgi:hypothetical protein
MAGAIAPIKIAISSQYLHKNAYNDVNVILLIQTH